MLLYLKLAGSATIALPPLRSMGVGEDYITMGIIKTNTIFTEINSLAIIISISSSLSVYELLCKKACNY